MFAAKKVSKATANPGTKNKNNKKTQPKYKMAPFPKPVKFQLSSCEIPSNIPHLTWTSTYEETSRIPAMRHQDT